MTGGFRALHPFPCLLYYVCIAVLSMLLLHPVFLFCSAALLGLTYFVYEPRRSAVNMMLLFLAMGVLWTMLNPLFTQRGEHVMFLLWGRRITWEAFAFGLTLMLSSLTIMFSFFSYRHVVTNDKFLYLFASFWPKGTMVTVMAMRFVPLFHARLRAVTAAQRTKGISLQQGSLRQRAAGGMSLLQVLLTWSLEEALQTADSMKARGYGVGRRSAYSPFRMRPGDWASVTFILAAAIYCVAGRLNGYGLLSIYPAMESWRLSGPDLAQLAVFLCLVAYPLWLEGKERLAWRFWK